MYCIGFFLHERAGAGLHIEHQRIDALSDLLAHNRRADQRRTLHRSRHIAQRIHLLVSRDNLFRLPNQHHSASGEHLAHSVRREIYVEAGNRLELVERAASVPEAASAGCSQRRNQQRRFVADATG